MNGLTPGLVAAQQSQSPRYALEVLAGPRSTAWGMGGARWQTLTAFPSALATWHGQSIATDAVVVNGGVLRAFLSWRQGALACQTVPAAHVGSAAAWCGNGVNTVASFSATAGLSAPRPALVSEGGRVHLYYALPDGNIYHRQSSDGGATWGSASGVYSGGDVEGDICACHFAADDVHFVHFSTRTDTLRLRGASRKGSGGWNVWPVHGAATGWVAAGIMATGARTATLLAWARTPNPYEHYLGALACSVTAAGAPGARDSTVEVVWLVSGDTAIRPARHCVGKGLGGWLHTCQEQSAGRAYLCVGGIDAQPCRLEEPAPVTATQLPTTLLERHSVPLELATQTLLVGLTEVHASTHIVGDVQVDGDGVIAYRCDMRAGQGGTLDLTAPVASPLAAARAGWGLWLTRRCTKGSDTGAATLGLRVLRVEHHPGAVRLIAADALGVLAEMRARRALQFTPYAMTASGAVERLAAWAGLGVACSDVGGTAPLMQWSGGEAGLHALHVLLRAQTVGVCSRAAAGARPQVAAAARGATVLANFGPQAHRLIAHVRVEDARSPALVVVHGLQVRGAPEEGEEWVLASTANAEPMVRALPAYVLNRNLESAAQVGEASALLAEIAHAQPAGWIEIPAHLTIEPNDCICVEGETVYVNRIVEEWERRRLIQRVVYGR